MPRQQGEQQMPTRGRYAQDQSMIRAQMHGLELPHHFEFEDDEDEDEDGDEAPLDGYAPVQAC